DDSLEKIREFGRNNKLKLRVFARPHRGPAAARNFGGKQAKGDVIVFIDSDCVAGKNWLSEMLAPFKDGDVVGVQGAYETLNKENIVARYVGYEIAFRQEGMARHYSVDFVGSFSAAYRRKIFLDSGGFDEAYTEANAEDTELSFRLRSMGFKLAINPNAIVAHRHPKTLSSYLRQQFTRGFWRVPLYLRHKSKVLGDSYTGSGLTVQAILATLFIVSILTLKPPLMLGSGLILALSNLPLGLFCLKYEKKFFIFAPLFASLRSIAGTLGALFGVLKFAVLNPILR
ncbi:MAG: glycosyltransferase, partial [Methanobacteriota archaeon]